MDGHPLTPGGNTLVVLDTCVLLPSRLSDVLFDLMLQGLYFAYWTGDVETCRKSYWRLSVQGEPGYDVHDFPFHVS